MGEVYFGFCRYTGLATPELSVQKGKLGVTFLIPNPDEDRLRMGCLGMQAFIHPVHS